MGRSCPNGPWERRRHLAAGLCLSTATHTEAEWSGASQTLRTNHGSGSGIVRSDVVYLDAATAQNLYGLAGGLGPDLVYRLQSRPVVTLYGDGSQKPAKPAQPVR